MSTVSRVKNRMRRLLPGFGAPDTEAPEWRGVAAEDEDEITGSLATFLRTRSRTLLGSVLRPHRRSIIWAAILVVVQTAATLAGPYLVKMGIDRGIPPLLPGNGG